MDNQEKTLKTYEKNFEKYFTETPSEVSGDFKVFFDHLISLLPTNAKMLEIGSGTGRDADYFESHGIKVTRTDVVSSFIEYQRNNGRTISQFNILTDEIEEKWDLVFANAVLLHFNVEQFSLILKKIVSALNPTGLIAFTVKTGEGEEWSVHKMESPRFFKYWNKEKLQKAVEHCGFKIRKLELVTDDTKDCYVLQHFKFTKEKTTLIGGFFIYHLCIRSCERNMRITP